MARFSLVLSETFSLAENPCFKIYSAVDTVFPVVIVVNVVTPTTFLTM